MGRTFLPGYRRTDRQGALHARPHGPGRPPRPASAPPAARGRRRLSSTRLVAPERRRGRAAEAGLLAAMDRFVWTSGLLEINETLVIQQRGVRIYDGEEKVGAASGTARGLAGLRGFPAPASGPHPAALGRPSSGSGGDGRRVSGCLRLRPRIGRGDSARAGPVPRLPGVLTRGASVRGVRPECVGSAPPSGRECPAGVSEKRVRVSPGRLSQGSPPSPPFFSPWNDFRKESRAFVLLSDVVGRALSSRHKP